MIEPSERLGAGNKDEGNDTESLKSHSFFEGINFQTLHTANAPIDTRNII